MVYQDESTYLVDWVPRPSAHLAKDTEATYDPYNNSYILPPICEGQSAHVDLDLTGMSLLDHPTHYTKLNGRYT